MIHLSYRDSPISLFSRSAKNFLKNIGGASEKAGKLSGGIITDLPGETFYEGIQPPGGFTAILKPTHLSPKIKTPGLTIPTVRGLSLRSGGGDPHRLLLRRPRAAAAMNGQAKTCRWRPQHERGAETAGAAPAAGGAAARPVMAPAGSARAPGQQSRMPALPKSLRILVASALR